MKEKLLLKMEDIRKSFLGVEVLKGIHFELKSGEIVSLAGTNGAGKSTLSNVIMGIYTKDSGEMWINGKEVNFESPKDAEKCGVGMVHQEPTLVNNMKVYENIFLNNELIRKGLWLDAEKMRQESRRILDFIGFDIDPNEKVENLTLVQKEVVEIAKAMLLNPSILILDEVTAPLNLAEVEHLFQIIRDLKKKGIGIIFIGHKIKELTQISDRVVIIRDGCNAGEIDNSEGNVEERVIIHSMLGETEGWQEEYSEKKAEESREEVLLSLESFGRKGAFEDVTFDLHKGEIIGLAGLKGSGITELMFSIYGAAPGDTGVMKLENREISPRSPHQAIRLGIGMITNDRQKENIAMTQSVKDNIIITSLNEFKTRFRTLKGKKLKKVSDQYIEKLSVKTTGGSQLIQFLSGGNQQKVVVAKWMLRDMKVLLIDEPTRGVDVKAKNEIYDLLIEQKRQGKAVMVSSPEERELLNISDRILVVSHGRIRKEIRKGDPEFSEAGLMEAVHAS